MKKLTALGIVVLALTLLAIVAPAIAKGPVGATLTIYWTEDAVRYSPDDSVTSSWTGDELGPAILVQTGKAYHFASIGGYYNCTLENLDGSLVISGGGNLSGHATYTSGRSGLPIRDRFQGQVSIEEGTLVGTYTQWSYAFGPKADVLEWYPAAVASPRFLCS
jgi:hypothetical protein